MVGEYGALYSVLNKVPILNRVRSLTELSCLGTEYSSYMAVLAHSTGMYVGSDQQTAESWELT